MHSTSLHLPKGRLLQHSCLLATRQGLVHARRVQHATIASAASASPGGSGETTGRRSQYEEVAFRQAPAGSSSSVPSTSSAPVPASTTAIVEYDPQEAMEGVQADLKLFLEEELYRIFNSGSITRSRYTQDFRFQDPIVSYTGIDRFVFNVQALRAGFKITFKLFNVAPNGPGEMKTRWTMRMTSRFLPWQPEIVFSGYSFYTATPAGQLSSQRDVWDALNNNNFPSGEGAAHVLQQLTSLQTVPNLEAPRYTVLKRTKEYEVRQYDPFLVADTAMPSGEGPAGGTGFQSLAKYIFGGNDRSAKMEMTTPVFTTAGQGAAGAMEFPMEAKWGSNPEELPQPKDSSVQRRADQGGLVAATSFSGLPLDWQVTDAERRLRAALLLDKLKPLEGWKLARYNDPFTLPGLRKNEVLIRLEGFATS